MDVSDNSHNLKPALNEKGPMRIDIVLVMIVIAAAIAMACQPVRSPDVWHHVACGRLVAQEGSPARADVFSHTAQGKQWIQYEWLAQLLIFLSWKLGGVGGLLVIRLIMVAAVAILFLLVARTRGAGPVAAALAVALALCALSGRFFSRPELFTWLLLGGVMLACEKIRRGRHTLFWAPAVLVIPWVNMHGAWIAGLAWMGLVCGGDSLSFWLKSPHAPAKRTVQALWLALALAFVATLVNPFGWHIWEVPFALSRSPEVKGHIAEWGRVTLGGLLKLRYVGIAVFLLSLILAPLRVGLGEWLVVIFFAWLSTRAVRHPPFALLVVSPLMATQLGHVWKAMRIGPGLRKSLASSRLQAAGAILACMILSVIALGGLGLSRAGWGMATNKFPTGAAEFLRKHRLQGNLYNTYDFGNLLMFEFYPASLVFIDGRVDMYGSEIVKLYNVVRTASENWQEILKQHDVEICVVKISDKTDDQLLQALHQSPDWALVFWDEISAVYMQCGPGRAEFLKNNYVYSVPADRLAVDESTTPDELARALRDYEHKLAENPECGRALWGKGECLRRRGDLTGAIENFSSAAALLPGQSVLQFQLGSCLLEAGKLDAAEGALQRALYLVNKLEDDKEGVRWKALWNLSLLYERRGALDMAVGAMERVVELVPRDQQAADRLNQLRQKRSTPLRRPL